MDPAVLATAIVGVCLAVVGVDARRGGRGATVGAALALCGVGLLGISGYRLWTGSVGHAQGLLAWLPILFAAVALVGTVLWFREGRPSS